jgi:hypothetical protein
MHILFSERCINCLLVLTNVTFFSFPASTKELIIKRLLLTVANIIQLNNGTGTKQSRGWHETRTRKVGGSQLEDTMGQVRKFFNWFILDRNVSTTNRIDRKRGCYNPYNLG